MSKESLISCDAQTLTILTKSLEHFGRVNQQVKTIEEMAELTKEVCKEIGGLLSNREAVIEELADVQIMIFQMQMIYGVDDVQQQIAIKLHRLKERMNY